MAEVAVSPRKDVVAWRSIARVCIVAVFIFLGLANVLNVVNTTAGRLDGEIEDGKPEDLLSFYSAGRFVLDGRAGDIYDPYALEQYQEALVQREVGGAEQGLPFFNPPYVAGLIAPLTALALPVFSVVFFAIVLGSVVAGGVLSRKLLPSLGNGSQVLLWFGYLSFLPVAWLLQQQQLTMFVFLGWLGFIWFETRGQHRLSGLSLALALVKPQSVVIILALLVWKRRWDTLGAFALAATPLVLLSLAVSGPQAIVEYPRFLLESTEWEGRGVNALGMFGWNGLAANIFNDRAPPLLSYLPLTLLTISGLVLLWRKADWQPRSPRFLLLCAVTFLSAMLTNPHFYLQDVTLLCIPLVLGAAWYSQRGAGATLVWSIAAVTWMVGMYGPQMQQDLHIPVFTPWMALVLLGLYLQLGREAALEPAVAAPEPSRAAA